MCVCWCVLVCVAVYLCGWLVVVGCWLLVIGCCSLLLVEQLVNTSGVLSEGRETRRSNIACSKGSDIPMFGGEGEEYKDWQYKGRIFLNSQCSPSARFLTYLENLHRDSAIGPNKARCKIAPFLWFL